MKCLLTSDLHANFTGKTNNKHIKFWKSIPKDIEQIFIAGDLGSSKLRDVEVCLKTFRECVPDLPTFIVFGNHDYWGPEPLEEKYDRLDELSRRYNCNYLDGCIHIDPQNRFTVFGFDGWYGERRPESNDHLYMLNKHSDFDTLWERGEEQWKNLRKDFYLPFPQPNILLHHFSVYPQYKLPNGNDDYEFCGPVEYKKEIIKYFDFYLSGHSHREADFTEGRCRFINSGSDYNNPKFKVFEI